VLSDKGKVKMKLAIYGTGGFGREIAPLAQYLGASVVRGPAEHESLVDDDVVFVDDAVDRPAVCNGISVIGFEDLLSDLHRSREIVVGIGDGRLREKIERRCEDAGLSIGTLKAPTTRILAESVIGRGAVLCDSVIITSNVVIGRSFQCNLNSYVAHDCVIGDYVTFAPNVCCNGNIRIENYAYVGTGAVFTQGKAEAPIIVGEGALVGMGSVVTKSVPAYTVVAGNPARPIRELQRL